MVPTLERGTSNESSGCAAGSRPERNPNARRLGCGMAGYAARVRCGCRVVGRVGSRRRPAPGSGPVEVSAERSFGRWSNRGVTLAHWNAPQTAGEPPLRHAQGWPATHVFPRVQSRLKTPSNAFVRSGARPACDSAPAACCHLLTLDPARRWHHQRHPTRSRAVGCGQA